MILVFLFHDRLKNAVTHYSILCFYYYSFTEKVLAAKFYPSKISPCLVPQKILYRWTFRFIRFSNFYIMYVLEMFYMFGSQLAFNVYIFDPKFGSCILLYPPLSHYTVKGERFAELNFRGCHSMKFFRGNLLRCLTFKMPPLYEA